MSIYNVNLESYTSDAGIAPYLETSLQDPEVSIFVKYKDTYYGKNILDIGCGAGRTSHYLRNFTDQYIGVDYSPEMIGISQKLYPDLKFNQCDARDLSQFSDNSFDFVIFSYNGIDYISNADRLLALKEINRVLKKDGFFVLSTHNINFSKIHITPRLNVSLNPIRFLKNIIKYKVQKQNNNRVKKEQVVDSKYSLINDSGNDFSLLTYYISKDEQIKQLSDTGFKTIEMFNMKGQTLEASDNDSNDAWVYFVAQKI